MGILVLLPPPSGVVSRGSAQSGVPREPPHVGDGLLLILGRLWVSPAPSRAVSGCLLGGEAPVCACSLPPPWLSRVCGLRPAFRTPPAPGTVSPPPRSPPPAALTWQDGLVPVLGGVPGHIQLFGVDEVWGDLLAGGETPMNGRHPCPARCPLHPFLGELGPGWLAPPGSPTQGRADGGPRRNVGPPPSWNPGVLFPKVPERSPPPPRPPCPGRGDPCVLTKNSSSS